MLVSAISLPALGNLTGSIDDRYRCLGVCDRVRDRLSDLWSHSQGKVTFVRERVAIAVIANHKNGPISRTHLILF